MVYISYIILFVYIYKSCILYTNNNNDNNNSYSNDHSNNDNHNTDNNNYNNNNEDIYIYITNEFATYVFLIVNQI